MEREKTITELLFAENTLDMAHGRGNIPTDNMIAHNLKRVRGALEGLRAAEKVEPLCWRMRKWGEPPDPRVVNLEMLPETLEQQDEGDKAYSEWLEQVEKIDVYTLPVARVCEELKRLSVVRETLTEDSFRRLQENFSLFLSDFDVLTEA